MITQPQLTLLRRMAEQSKAADMDVALGWNVVLALVDAVEQSTAVVKAAQRYNARPYGVENGALRAALDDAIREAKI